MSFWEKAGKVAVGAAKKVAETASEWSEIKQRLEPLSNDELVRIAQDDGFFGKSSNERMIAKNILASRGVRV